MSVSDMIDLFSKSEYHKSAADLTDEQLHYAVSKAVMASIADNWEKSQKAHIATRRACYFSAEFMMGRAVFNNLICSGLKDDVSNALSRCGHDISQLEASQDALLGNGGLGRLAACFLDSAATLNLPVDGYGIRYRFGLFKQDIKDGFQQESVQDWLEQGDPWSVRCESDAVRVHFARGDVTAVPYDMPIIGFGTNHVSTLRLWQCEPLCQFNFKLFNEQCYDQALKEKNRAENISRVLYPNDSTDDGKLLRLEQQYFFSSASLCDIVKKYVLIHGNDFVNFSDYVTIQLNDTHPVISIPEFIRILMSFDVSFDDSVKTAKNVFNYTNHTVMQEALEKWDISLINQLSPAIVSIIERIDKKLSEELDKNGVSEKQREKISIISNGTVNMAYLACYMSKHINGVARLHTDILINDVLSGQYKLWSNKFSNKTNGITQRRWLYLSNPGLSALITRLLGSSDWICDLPLIKELEEFAHDEAVQKEFQIIKSNNKKTLCDYVFKRDGITFNTNSIIDVQIKRLHEYKRQLLNILAILELYFEIKEGALSDFVPTTFIFAAKAAPGYDRAKGIIKLINEVARLIKSDDDVNKYIDVVFVSDYDVSYAEKIVAAADVSEQISTAGTEASGTGNMKLMLNGAVTIGTYDGANIEIVNEAGEENNYIFGARVEELVDIKKSYNPQRLYNSDKRIKRCLDALIDGTLDDMGTGYFQELYDSLLKGASWHTPDQYFLLRDFDDFIKAKIKINSDYKDIMTFSSKCWLNMCNAGKFSSDRTIDEYAREIWHIKPIVAHDVSTHAD